MEDRPNKDELEIQRDNQLAKKLKERLITSTGNKYFQINRLIEGDVESRTIIEHRPSRDELEVQTVAQLKQKLKERGIKSTGNKNSLINRLMQGYFESRKGVVKCRSRKSKSIYCCIPRCANHSHTEGVKLHRIPTSKKRRHTRNQWLCKLKQVRPDFQVVSATRVCGDHFKPEEIVNGSLNAYAVPGVFISKDIHDQSERTSASWVTDPNIKEPTRGNNHLCPLTHCGRVYHDLHHLNKHLLKHPRDKTYVCSDCGKKYSSLIGLKTHMLTHTGEKPHVCSDCGKRLSHLSDLKTHMLSHTEEKPHVCSDCGKRLSHLGDLKKHMLTHTGEQPHVCSDCGKGFHHVCSLKKHMSKHIGEKLYVCDECGKRFSELSGLKKHLETHIDRKLHICFDCGTAFDELNDLNQHMLTHARHVYDDSYGGSIRVMALNNYDSMQDQVNTGFDSVCSNCSICVYGFILVEDLSEHLLSHI